VGTSRVTKRYTEGNMKFAQFLVLVLIVYVVYTVLQPSET
jgi:hypothetical protein